MNTSGRRPLTRRHMLGMLSAAAAPKVLRASARSLDAGTPAFSLTKEIGNSFYGAVSPDAALLCVCSSTKPVGKIRMKVSQGSRAVSEEAAGPFAVRIIEIGSWRELARTSIGGNPLGFSFFASGQRLLAAFEIGMSSAQHMILIDAASSQVERTQIPDAVDYHAFQGNALIGLLGARQLVQVEWPDMKELARADASGEAGAMRFTANRLVFIHRVDQDLVCRRSRDFSVLWRRPVDPDIDLLARMPWNPPGYGPHLAVAAIAISADGGTVVLAPRRAAYKGTPGRAYIEFLEGGDGKPITRWSANFKDEIVLSADGKLAATGETIRNRSGCLEPTIRIYEVPSGAEVASFIHDQVPPKNRVNAYLNGGMEFTPDGRYLITSANNKVKIWSISG